MSKLTLSNAVYDRVVKHYTPVNARSGKETKSTTPWSREDKNLGILKKRKTPAVHRTPTPWESRPGLELSDLPMTDITSVVLDDPVASIHLAFNATNTSNSSVVLLSSDSCFNNILGINTIPLDDMDDVNSIKNYKPPMTKEFNFVGNNAFSITDPVLTDLISRNPLNTRLVTTQDNFNGMPSSSAHKSRNNIFNGLISIGLEKVYFLPNMLFEQYSPDSTGGTHKAQVSTLVFHAKREFNDRINVYGYDGDLLYTADRNIAKFLPKTKLSYLAGHMPELPKTWVGGPVDWVNQGQKGAIPKSSFSPLTFLKPEVSKHVRPGTFRIQIPVMNNGTPGNNTFWKEHNVGYHLAYAKELNPNQDPDWQTNVISFGSDPVLDKMKRDSILSLMQTRSFQEIYQAASTSKNCSSPVLSHFLRRFPADRAWTDQEVVDYVTNNKQD